MSEDPNPLISLFRQCVVCITGEDGKFRGSGFFAAPGQVVTCAHVVHKTQGLRVYWQGRVAAATVAAAVPPLESVSDPRSYPLPDLAVLDCGSDGRDWDHPCVALAGGQPVLDQSAAGLFLAGYTQEHSHTPALTGVTMEFESLVTEEGPAFFKLKRGLVLPGFSGSPLLDRQAGSVSAIVESTRSRQAELGGFAVPVAELAAAFPLVLEANQAFHDRDRRWTTAAEIERVLDADRKGRRALLPLRPPATAPPAGEDVSAATALRPRYAMVGYVGREQLLGDIAAWCEQDADGGGPVEAWFVTGGGGFGKTRLAMEACVEAGARGWTAGLLRPDAAGAKLEALAGWPGRLLVAIDYAETRPALIGQLVEEFAARAPRPRVRMLLLVRRRASRAELLRLFNEQREEQLDAVLRAAPLSRLEEAQSEVDRLELFNRAVEDFSRVLGAAGTPKRPPRLRAAHFARPLYVLAAAYLARAVNGADVDALDETALLRELLTEHEAAHWNRWNDRRQLGLDPADQRAAVALATLLTATGEEEALAVTRLIPHFGGEPEPRLMAIARWLAQLYPAPAADSRQPPSGSGPLAIAPLEPDRLGEVLTGDVLSERPGLLGAALDAASDRQLARALTVAGRVARGHPAVCDQLRLALDERLGDFCQRGFAAEDDELTVAVVNAMAVSRPVRGALETAERLPTLLPVSLRFLAVNIVGLAVGGLRARAGSDPGSVPELARQLSNFGFRLGEAGQREEAIAAAREAVTLYRDLPQADSAAHLPGLAVSLGNLGNQLNYAGRDEEAMAAEEEAVALFRRLVQASPAFLPGLASGLGNLSRQLNHAGRNDEAVAAEEEAVALFRRLAQADPAEYLAGLARSLSNLSNWLSTSGRRDEALAAEQEAVGIRTRLTQADPSAHLPELAISLTNLGHHLSESGQYDQALTATQEAVTLFRGLAQASPAQFLGSLADSLDSLGNRFRETGQHDQALTATQEAVTLYRDLARANPGGHLAGLANSLSNLGNQLSEAGRREEALAAGQEAVTIRRRLAEANPAAYLPRLADSLNNLGIELSENGHFDDALSPTREAVTIRRRLAEANPAARLPELAQSLANLGNRLSEVGEPDEALTATQEAVAIRRGLFEANPVLYLPYMADSLALLGSRLSGTGQYDQAIAAIEEAVGLYRALTQENRALYLPDLAGSLNSLSDPLRKTAHRDGALAAAQEAVTLYRGLAQANPVRYLPELAASLSNLCADLGHFGRADEAELLLSDVLGAFSDTPVGVGHTRLTRGRWLLTQDRLDEALADLDLAVTAFTDADDRRMRGQTRLALRALRQAGCPAFDDAWAHAVGAMPVWLMHPTASQELISKIISWIDTPDLAASKAYLDANAAILLTDDAEAALEYLSDANPASPDPDEHLAMVRMARARDTAYAYAAVQDQARTMELTRILYGWLVTGTPEESSAYATAHSDDLLQPAALKILDSSGRESPSDSRLRAYRGLLGYATIAGFDVAYGLMSDPGRLGEAVTDPATSPAARLALMRLHSGVAGDDPEAHFQLAAADLLLLPVAADAEVTGPIMSEAAAALTDCAVNAAPYERRDFSSRLHRMTADHPHLGPYITELQLILNPPR